MTLIIHTYILGPLENNTYLLAEPESGQAVVIDPSFGIAEVAQTLRQNGWTLAGIWFTHAHYDHIAGTQELVDTFGESLPMALHPADLRLWQHHGGANMFGMRLDIKSQPNMELAHGQLLRLGGAEIQVRHTPGHTPGHVVFYAREINTVFCGDLIFQDGVGRTDLPGGSELALVQSIREQIFTLPDETQLLSGHGPETTVRDEKLNNPYIR